MSESDKKREQLERAYKIASRHYERCLADFAAEKNNESFYRYEYELEYIASNLRAQAPYLMQEFILNRRVHGQYSKFDEMSEKKAHERHKKAINKRNKLAARAEQYSKIHTKALIKIQDYMSYTGETVV